MASKMLGVKTMTPRWLHDAPRPSGASHSICTGPPDSATFFNFPTEKKPMYLPSGDQNGKDACSIPSSIRAVPVVTSRTHNSESLLPPVRKASLEPSGESAGALAATAENSLSVGASHDAVRGRRASSSCTRVYKKIAS